MKALKDDLDSKDDRVLKEIVAFLIVFGEPLNPLEFTPSKEVEVKPRILLCVIGN